MNIVTIFLSNRPAFSYTCILSAVLFLSCEKAGFSASYVCCVSCEVRLCYRYLDALKLLMWRHEYFSVLFLREIRSIVYCRYGNSDVACMLLETSFTSVEESGQHLWTVRDYYIFMFSIRYSLLCFNWRWLLHSNVRIWLFTLMVTIMMLRA